MSESALPETAAPEIDALHDHCLRFVSAFPQTHARAFALTKLAEMIYWLRAAEARRRAGLDSDGPS